MALKEAYAHIYKSGGYYLHPSVIARTLSSKKIKIKPKTLNIAGLQLADTLAHPLTRDVLVAYKRIPSVDGAFAQTLIEAVHWKYNHQIYRGTINGYGRVILA
jgi:hypothetical protein